MKNRLLRQLVYPFLTIIIIFPLKIHAQQKKQTPLEVVQAQLDAYNKQDIKAFGSLFANDVIVYNKIGDSLPALIGREALEKRYDEIFKTYPKNFSTLLGRIVESDFIIDHELITGREKPLRIVAIYEVREGQIKRCWFIR